MANTKAGGDEMQHEKAKPNIVVTIIHHRGAVLQQARHLQSQAPSSSLWEKSVCNEELSAHSLACVLLTNCYSDGCTLK